MFEDIAKLYISLLPVIVAGTVNAFFCKSTLLASLNKPIDNGMVLNDGRPLFGSSKTYKGLIGYVVLTSFFTMLWGYVSTLYEPLADKNFFYVHYANTPIFNTLLGATLGLAWGIFELPNSFLKRRLHIGQSVDMSGYKKYVFILFDQADSLFGVMLILALFYPLDISQYFLFVVIGTLTHLLFNYALYRAKVRKNPL